jgi:NAD(P)-dependent dehydrogenase (short-subunit alcohol dehydrogenase family)
MAPAKARYVVPDQSGRTAIVTGANSGLGLAVTRALAEKNARVIMACRDEEKGRRARQWILEELPHADLRVEQLDLSSLQSVRHFSRRLSPGLSHLDLLVNNAGVMVIPERRSAEGYEMHFATNHLGHFLLTGLLMPQLLVVGNSRVVVVTSLAVRGARINFDDLMGEKRYDSMAMYYQSKLANLMFGLELQRRLERGGAATSAVIAHPGLTLTNTYYAQSGSTFQRMLLPALRRFALQSPEDGAQPLLYAATSPDARPGGFYGPAHRNESRGPPAEARIPGRAMDEDVARRLWQKSEQLVDFTYPGLVPQDECRQGL